MIAQILISIPANIAAWLACLAFVVVLLNGLIRLKRNLWPEDKPESRSISPQPLGVKLEPGLVTEAACKARHLTLEGQMSEMRQAREEDTRVAALSRKAIYERIEQKDEAMRLHIEDVRKELSEKIDGTPDRIIAILRNFGVIGKPSR
jgi:hypothetical protein